MTLQLTSDLRGRFFRAAAAMLGALMTLCLALDPVVRAATPGTDTTSLSATLLSLTDDGFGSPLASLPTTSADGTALDAPDQPGDSRSLLTDPVTPPRETGSSALRGGADARPDEIGLRLPERPPRG